MSFTYSERIAGRLHIALLGWDVSSIAGACSNVVEPCDLWFGTSVDTHAHSFNTRARAHTHIRCSMEPSSFSFLCRSRRPNKMSTHPLDIRRHTSYASSSHLCHRRDSCSGLANFRSLSACIRLSFHSLNG